MLEVMEIIHTMKIVIELCEGKKVSNTWENISSANAVLSLSPTVLSG